MRNLLFCSLLIAFGFITKTGISAGHTVALELTDVSCHDLCDGKAKAIVTGATGPIVINWVGNSLPPNTKGDSIVNLCPGFYSVEVIDKNDNTSSGVINFEIKNKPPFFWSISTTPISCFGEDDGGLTISVSGATPPYRYAWSTSPTDTTNTIDSLVSGTYFVQVTDTNGCTFNDTIFLQQPDSIMANVALTNASCKNICDGTARALTTGGTPPYTYNWSNGDTLALADGLCDGSYDVVITDNNGCQGFDTIVITEPDSLLVSYVIDSVDCADSCNGSIIPLVSGGVPPYQFNWAPTASMDSILSNACPGLYMSTITDDNGCYQSENLLIEANSAIAITDSIGLPDCGMCNGAIKVFPTGGAGKYNYLWNTGNPNDTNQLLTGLCSGIYEVNVTDTLGCSELFSILLNDSSSLKGISVVSNNPSCKDSANGSASAIPIGGIAPFTYDWQPIGLTDSTVYGLTAGTYYITITDSAGCNFTKKVDINPPTPIDFQPLITNTTCSTSCDGQIVVNPIGGAAPYSLYWVETGTTAPGISNLCKGWYHLELTDANGCSHTDSFFVDSAAALQISVSAVDASCFGSCDGMAIPQVSGGTPPYRYNWSTGSVHDSLFNVCAGNYSLKVIDANGCESNATFVVNQASEIIPNYTVEPSECGLNDGKIFLNPTGGANAYLFHWFNGTKHDSLTGLKAGVYSVQISDTNGCTTNVQIPVPDDNGPDINVSINHVSCYGECNGSATANALSGQGPYQYVWSTGDSTASVSGLCEGKYFVMVTDGYGCTGISEVNILENKEIDIQFQLNPESCPGTCDGNALAFVQGGVPPYRFNWSVGGNQNAVNNLCGGIYTLTVTDSVNCSQTKQFEIETSEELSIDFDRKNLSCFNTCDGELFANIIGGKAPFNFAWSNGNSTALNPGLCAGNYTLTVTDANGCVTMDSIQIGSSIPQIAVSPLVTNAGCGLCDGAVALTASGGNGAPYTFNWLSLNQTGSNLSDLCAGIYPVEVIDNNGCSNKVTVIVNNIGGPSLTDSVVEVGCNGDCDGKAIVTATGGGPFSYQWNDSALQITDTAFNLCEGNYSVVVLDTNGCLTSAQVTINEPSLISTSFNITKISCPADSGAIRVNVSGGAPPYSYLWSTNPNDTIDFVDSLPSGTYSVIVRDTNGCEVNDTVDLADPTPLSISFDLTNVLCFSSCDATASAIVAGGTAPYTYMWNDPFNQIDKRAIGLCSGTYKVTVTDANGCMVEDSVTLTEPPSISLNFIPVNPTCAGGNSGTITIVPSGGVPPFSYVWDDGQKSNPAIGLGAGPHSVVVIDSNGCTAYDTIMLNNPTPLSATFNVANAQCDSANGTIQATPTGGSGNYTYVWSTIPTKTSAFITGLNAGTYEVTITDNITFCAVTYTVIVNNTGGPALSVSAVDESCYGACNGSAIATAPTAIAYFWDDPNNQILASATNLCSGTYSVTVMDTGGCKTTDTVTIGTTKINTFTSSIRNTSCNGSCDGEAAVISTGGTSPYTYSWNTAPPQIGNMVNSLCAGSYIVTATDSNSCTSDASILISSPDILEHEIKLLSPTVCQGSCNGEAEIIVTGGTAPYSYSWSNGATASFNYGLCSGMNFVTVTDANGCTISDTFNISTFSPIQINQIITRPLCGLSDGKISLSVSGGQGPYTYQWSSGQQVSEISGLFAGIYEVTVTDNEGCSRSSTYFLNNPNAPQLNFANNTVDCRGDCNGIAIVSPVGGVGPYQFVWDYVPASFIDTLSDLCSGVYTVKVTDNVGCIAFGNDTIREPEELIVNSVVDEAGCGGECIGVASANPTGGTPPYRYQWNTSPIKNTSIANGLCAGNYNITVTDTNDCVSMESVVVSPPPALIVDSITSKPASCNDENDGEAAVYVSGGTTPYGYFWNDGNITSFIPNTVGALRIVQITDANGCMIQDTVLVTVEDTVTVTAIDNFSACFDQEIELSAVGSGVVSFQWFEVLPNSINQIGNDSVITVLLSDTTEYIIRGSNAGSPECAATDTVLVSGIPAPLVDAGPDETIVRGESTILDNVIPFLPFGFQSWSPGRGLDDSTIIRPRASPQETTTYTITITDEFGCFASDTITVFVTDREVVYNGISPNGDGVNDTWTIELIEDFPDAIVEVYNRWGQLIFRSEGYKEKWDGTYEGNPLPDGTYYYVIDLQVQGREALTGTITILK